MHVIYTTADALKEYGAWPFEFTPNQIQLTHHMSEGITGYTVSVKINEEWVPQEEKLHLTADTIAEAVSSGILNSLMGEDELAKRLGMDKRVLNVLLSRGKMVKPVKRLACGPLFLSSDVDEWIAKNGKPKESKN